MTEVIVFHHALGLTPGMTAFADDLRAAGHTVHTPDLFEGRTFATIDEGVAHAQEIGFGEVIERATRAAEQLPAEVVYAGFSLGVRVRTEAHPDPARRPGRAFLLLVRARVLSSAHGPTGCPHRSTAWTTTRSSWTRVMSTPRANWPRRTTESRCSSTPATSTIFADPTLPTYDADAAALLMQRSLDFLARGE